MVRSNQHYALDESGKLIHIDEVDKSEGHIYRCPNPKCGQEMIARKGDIRDWHFAHKKKECGYDNYLHSLAERRICEWFNDKENKSILLKLRPANKCSSYEECKWFEILQCEEIGEIKEINLKEYFDSCEVEKDFKKGNDLFRADIFCHNIKNEKNPLFIEIYVKHECDRVKTESGIKIIEVKIDCEEDIDKFISYPIEENKMIVYHNFKPAETLKELIRPFQKFILFSSGKSYIEKEKYSCKNYNKEQRGVFEVSMYYDIEMEDCIPSFFLEGGFYAICQALAYRENPKHKHCSLCKWKIYNKWDGLDICKLYKRCGTQKYCKNNNAYNCLHFRLDEEKYDALISAIKESEDAGAIDIWKSSNWK